MNALFLSLLLPFNSHAAAKIVNADIAAAGTANIARNKLASGTNYAWCVNSSSGVLADTAVTVSRAVATDANGAPVASATTAAELGFVNGVTSAIQTQLNGKQASGNYITALTGDVTASGPGSVAATVAKIQGTTISGTTGTTNVVFSSSPTLVTPVLGAATATTVNKVTITPPASGSTLTIADGKTLTSNNTLTLSGTDSSTLNIGAGGTLGSAAFTNSTAYASSTLTAAHIFAGNVSNVATDVAVGGDLTMDNAGAFTIGAGKVTAGKLANTAVTPGSYTSANITVDQQGRITLASNGSGGSVGAINTFSMTITGTTTNPTKNTGAVSEVATYQCIGDSMFITYDFRATTGGAAGSGAYLFLLPNSQVIDTTKRGTLPAGQDGWILVGHGIGSTTSTAFTATSCLLNVYAYDSTHLILACVSSSTALTVVGSAEIPFGTNPLTYSFNARVPVSGCN